MGKTLSAEEKADRKRQRDTQRDERNLKFPGAWLDASEGDRLVLDDGDPSSLIIQLRDQENKFIWLGDDLSGLARFIFALCARLNFLIETANEDIKQIRVKPLGTANASPKARKRTPEVKKKPH